MDSCRSHHKQLLIVSPGLLVVVVFYAAGICWAESLELPLHFLLYSLLSLLILLFFLHSKNLIRFQVPAYILLGLVFFLLGLLQHDQIYPAPPPDPQHIYNLIPNKQTAGLDGILLQYPSVINTSSGPETRLLAKVKTVYQLTGANPPTLKCTKSSGRILLTMQGALPEDIKPGDRFLAQANISRVSTYSTPGSFDYKKHLANQAIFNKGWIPSAHDIIKIRPDKSSLVTEKLASLRYLPERIRNHIAGFLDNTLSQPARGLYKAILIGDRNDVPRNILDNFTAAGCIHILAISGMHMGLLALVTIAILSWILKRSTWLLLHGNILKIAVTAALMPLLNYALIAGFNIPVQRALLMTVVFILAILFDRPGNLINHILLAAFLILAWKPGALFTASFQLSFSAVIAIALIYPLIYRFLFRKNYPGLSFCARPGNKRGPCLTALLHKVPITILNWSLAGFILTTAAMAGTFPLLLYHFNRLSLVAPFTNLLVEPLVCFWSLVIGLAASSCIPILPGLAKILFVTGSYGLTLAGKICSLFAKLPYASLWLPTPAPIEIILFYLFLLSLIIVSHITGSHRRCYLFIAGLLFCAFLAATQVITKAESCSGSAIVTFLDVGHGCSILLQLPENKNILIDGGGAETDRFDIGARVIGPFLWKQRISRLEAVIVTHPHADHYNGLPFILTRFRPREIWINGFEAPDWGYSELLGLADKLGIATKIAQTDDILYQKGLTRLRCLHSGLDPAYQAGILSKGKGFDTNDLSIVLRLETDNGTYLFPADISAALADMLVKEGKKLKADILMAPHHGSASSLNENFITSVAPSYIVISAGRNDPFHFPAKSLYDLERLGIRVLSTNKDGTISFHINEGEIEVQSYQVN